MKPPLPETPAAIRETLDRLAARLPDVRDPPGGRATVPALRLLARAWPGPLGAGSREDLRALVRKVHVATRLDDRYGAAWDRAERAEPLGAAAWSLLIAVLLAFAEAGVADDEQPGFGLRNLNAALVAIDRARRLGLSEAWLEAWAGAAVARLAGTAP